MGTSGLRTSLIWHDEVMGDVVHEKPAKVTLGTASDATFTTPDIAGTPTYAIVTPGRRGYLLTLSAQMSGTICIGGIEHEVSAWVRAGDEGSGFRGTPIGGNDWGVISVDGKGDHKLFFQFVPLEEADWNLGHPMVIAAVGGFALSALALTGLWAWKGVPLGEAAFRGGSLASLAIGLAAVVRWVLKQDNESRASLAFSVMLHSAILFATFQLYEKSQRPEWPEQSSVTGGYMVKLDKIEEPKPEKPKQEPTVKPGADVPSVQKLPERRPWERPKGKKVEKPSTEKITKPVEPKEETGRGKPANDMPSTTIVAPKVGLFVHDKVIHGIIGRDLGGTIDKYVNMGGKKPGETAGSGPPGAGGPGGTKGTPGGNGPVGEREGTGAINTGPIRGAVCIGAGCGTGGGGPALLPPPNPPPPGEPTLSKEDIDKVIKAHQNLFKTCYQKALDREGLMGGDVVMHFEITPGGKVRSSSQAGGTLRNTSVVTCMKNALGILTFPAKGGAIVNYPFAFSAGQ